MKKLNLLFFVAVLSCLVMGCSKSVEVSFGVESQTMSADGGTFTVELKSNGDWTLSTNADWLTVSPMSGNGDATLTIVVQPNSSDQERSQQVKASSKDNTAVLTISQEAAEPEEPVEDEDTITLTPSLIECGEEGGDFSVDIETEMAWTVSGLPEWMSCSAMEGEGNASVRLTVLALFEDGTREAEIVFGDENATASLHVVQTRLPEPQHYLDVTPTELQILCTGESKELTLTCDEAWYAISDADWASLSKSEGEGDDVIVVTVEENPSFVTRQSTVKFVSTSNQTVVVFINQEATPDPHYLEVNPTEITFANTGGDHQISIECDEDWILVGSEEWLLVSVTEGTGDGVVTITATPNEFNETRNALLKVVSRNITRRIVVTQEPGEEVYYAEVEPDTLFLGQTGGIGSFTISSNIAWTIDKPSWVTYCSVAWGAGDATVEFMADANNSLFERIGNISIMRNGEVWAKVVLVQEGIPSILTTDVTEMNFTREGGQEYFHLTANQGWTLRTNVEWLTCYPSEGSGNEDILVKVGEWISSEPRVGIVTIIGSYGTITTVTVTQSN